MIYITFERRGHKFSDNTARALAQSSAVQQSQLTAKRLLCSTTFFVFFNNNIKYEIFSQTLVWISPLNVSATYSVQQESLETRDNALNVECQVIFAPNSRDNLTRLPIVREMAS